MNLTGKKITFLGDSITEGVGVTDQNNRYDNILLRELHLSGTQNQSVSGSRLAHQMVPSEKPHYDLCFSGRAYFLDTTADVCIVYGGVNDYIHGDAYVGEETDTTPATFWGGVNFLMKALKDKFPGKPIVFLTPARSCLRGVTDMLPSPRPMKKPDAMALEGYADIIVAAGKKNDVHVLDLFRDLPVNPNNQADFEKYTTDGLHFNDEGHKLLAKMLMEFLLAL